MTKPQLHKMEKAPPRTVYRACSNQQRLFRNGYPVTPHTADEELARKKDAPSEIPIVQRDEVTLPDSDLLKMINYYAAMKYPEREDMFDGSALLAIGFLIESWVEEMVTDDTYKLFLKQEKTKKTKKKRETHEDKASHKKVKIEGQKSTEISE